MPTTATINATAAATPPIAKRVMSRVEAARTRSKTKPIAMSTSAPTHSASFKPSPGISRWMARKTPRIDPMVFQAYTRPMDRSPKPERNSVTVNSGKVVPAKNAAGIMINREIPAVPRLNSTYPPSVCESAAISQPTHSKALA